MSMDVLGDWGWLIWFLWLSSSVIVEADARSCLWVANEGLPRFLLCANFVADAWNECDGIAGERRRDDFEVIGRQNGMVSLVI